MSDFLVQIMISGMAQINLNVVGLTDANCSKHTGTALLNFGIQYTGGVEPVQDEPIVLDEHRRIKPWCILKHADGVCPDIHEFSNLSRGLPCDYPWKETATISVDEGITLKVTVERARVFREAYFFIHVRMTNPNDLSEMGQPQDDKNSVSIAAFQDNCHCHSWER